MKPIRCIECYLHRPGGRCDFCPLHSKNKDTYFHLENGWYQVKTRDETAKKMDENSIF